MNQELDLKTGHTGRTNRRRRAFPVGYLPILGGGIWLVLVTIVYMATRNAGI